MAKGPLRTFFRQNAGYPGDEEDAPDMTDFLLDSMITGGAGGAVPTSTSLSRATAAPRYQQYPAMPGAPPRPRPMPQMRGQTLADVLSQALAGAGDVISAGTNRPTNYLQQTMGLQRGMRGESYQQALAQRAAMEQASRLAHEYEWRKYGAGQQEKRQAYSEKMKQDEMDLFKKALEKQKADAERQGAFQNFMYEQGAAAKFKDLGGLGDLQEALEAATLQARTPEELQAIQAAAAKARSPLDQAKQKADAESSLQAEIEAEARKILNIPQFAPMGGYEAVAAMQEARRRVMERRKR